MIDNSDYWYPWKPVKFRAATMNLSDDQELIYRRLIDYYMETGKPVPDSMIALAKISGVSVERITDAWVMLKSFFQSHDGKLFQDECEENLNEQNAKTKKRVKRAKNAADSRWKNKIKSKDAPSNAKTKKDDAWTMLGDATGEERRGNKEESITNVTLSRRSPDIPKSYTDNFLEFWNAYPKNHGSKAEAFKAYNNAVRKGNTHESIINGAKRFADFSSARGTEERFTPHGSTWINGRRWESDYSESITTRANGTNPRPKTNGERIEDAKNAIIADISAGRV